MVLSMIVKNSLHVATAAVPLATMFSYKGMGGGVGCGIACR